ncbi:MAG TPA: hypothetical protein VFC46_10985 [Humisphaera sp.]|nr:hypothetical protein [Humisphaera sp.]
MKLTLVQVAEFAFRWKSLRLKDADLQALEQEIMRNPAAGDVMAGTGGVRKILFAPPSWNTGKSGATRVCYALFASIDAVYLLTIFGKNEQANLTAAERAATKKLMTAMKKLLGEE